MNRTAQVMLMSVGLGFLGASAVDAQVPIHRYSFTSDVSDSIGGAHGAVVDAGANPNAVFSGGMLDLSANTGQGSNGITEDAYVGLPNGIVNSAARRCDLFRMVGDGGRDAHLAAIWRFRHQQQR